MFKLHSHRYRLFYRPWKNSDGQVTLFQQALRNPDVFNFADHHYHPVAVEVLKVQPGKLAHLFSKYFLSTIIIECFYIFNKYVTNFFVIILYIYNW